MAEAEGEKKPGGGGPRSVKLLVVLGAVVVGLLICEVFLRASGYTYPVFYEPEEARGYALRPGTEGWYRKEGESYVRVNGEGLRDHEHAKEKPAGVLRVAVLGDSYAEALQVSQEKAFWSVLERRLGGCGALAGRRVEVINFGVSGYGTAQELITLREKVWDYSPDFVLLAFTTNNDITDNSRPLKKTDEIPYFVLREGRLVLDDSFRRTPTFRLRSSFWNRTGRWIRDHLRVIQLVHQAHGAIKSALARRRAQAAAPEPAAAAQQPGAGGQEVNAAVLAEAGADNLVYREPSDDVWLDAWRVTEALILQMRKEVEERGAKFLLVTLSNGIQVHPDPQARANFVRRLGATDLFYPDLRLRALGARAGFEVFNLAPALQRYAEERHAFLHGFGQETGNGHWNEEGHRVAGELLAQKLCEILR